MGKTNWIGPLPKPLVPSLPRPSLSTTTAPASAPTPPPAKKTTKRDRSPEDMEPGKISTRTNKCPLPGTAEANMRTVFATLSRCKSPKARADFLAEKGLTEEDVTALELRRASSRVEKVVRNRAAAREVAMDESGLSGIQTNASDAIDLAPSQPSKLSSLFTALQERIAMESNNRASLDAAEINAQESVSYYCGPGRPHLFFVILRIKDLDEEQDQSAPYDYDCVLTMRHTDLNGCEALQLTQELLSAIRHNSGSLRCELQNCANLREEGVERIYTPLLKSVIITTSISITLKDPEILKGDWLYFHKHRILPHNNRLMAEVENPTFILDITDIMNPKYCYLAHQDGMVQTLAQRPLKNIDIEKNQVWRYTHAMAEWQLVKIHAVLSTWPFLSQKMVLPLPFLENGLDEFWSRVFSASSYGQKWPIKKLGKTDLEQSFTSEGGCADLRKMLRCPSKGYYLDRHSFYLPFAGPQLSERILDFTDPEHRPHILTLAGWDPDARFTVLSTLRPGLVCLNLMYCQISNEELAAIHGFDTLDTFIHESTILPGIQGYNPVESGQKALKVIITYIEENDEFTDESRAIEEYTITGDESHLRKLNSGCRPTVYGLEHPFMGPISAVTCLRTLFNRLPLNSSCGRHPLLSPHFLNGVFCWGYKPGLQIGLPVTLHKKCWTERYPGTTLRVTCYRSRMYACFYRWNLKADEEHSGSVQERMTAQEFLVQYKNMFSQNIPGDILEICEDLGNWCGEGVIVGR
jgi:hypothetical protein